MPATTVLGFAILKANWELRRKDYLDNFVPIVAECIRLSNSDIVAMEDLSRSLDERFGLRIPRNTVETLLRRLSSAGYIKSRHQVYYRNHQQLNTLNFERLQREFLEVYERVVERIHQFANGNHQVSWSMQDAEQALLAYLKKYQFHALSTGTILEGAEYREVANGASRSTYYIIGDFIREQLEQESTLLDFFDTVSKGHMLSQAIFLYDTGQEQRRFTSTEVYIDSPLLIFALGYAGESRKTPVREMLQLASRAGARLCCFRHSLEEIRGILNSCAERIGKNLSRNGLSLSTEYFLEQGKTETDILLLINTLESDLRQIGVAIVDKPSYSEHSYVVDERKFEQVLQDEVRYSNQRALERDIDSIAATYRLRRGQSYHFAEDCRAIFVTANTSLAKATRRFFHEELNDNSVPLCYTDYVFTTLLWLKCPNEAPDISQKRLIAACFAATQPDDTLWNKYVQEVSKLEGEKQITSANYYLLRNSIYAKSELMRVTKGEEEAFTQGTIPEILQYVESQIRAEAEKKLIEKENENAQLQEELQNLKTKEAQISATRVNEEQRRQDKAREKARRLAKVVTKVVIVIAVIVVTYLLAFTSTLGPDIDSSMRIAKKAIIYFLQIVVVLLGAVNVVFGFTIIPFVYKLEDYLSTRLYQQIYH
jgi:hypothetical protein